MSKERGSFGGASGGARSAGGGPRGGVGLASRSAGAPRSFGAESGFSSRGLASLGKSAERPTLSFGNTAKPSFNTGKSERPSLSFAGNKFESTKQSPAKAPGVRYSPDFRGTPLSATRNTEVSKPQSAGKIEVSTVRPSSLAPRVDAQRTVPFTLPGREQTPQASTAPRIVPEIRGQKISDLYSKAEIKPTNMVTKEVIPQLPKGKEAQVTRREVLTKPTVQVQPGYRAKIDLTPLGPQEMLFVGSKHDVQKNARVQLDTQVNQNTSGAREHISIRSKELSRLAYLPLDEELLDEKEKKDKKKFEAEQIDRVAMAYLRAGLVANKGEALRRVDRVLGIDPTVLAANSRVEEHVAVKPVPERIGIKAPVEVPSIKTMPQTEVMPQVAAQVQATAETKTQLLAKVKGLSVAEKNRVDQPQPSAQPEAKVQTQTEQKKGVQKLVRNTKDTLEKIKVWTTKVKTPTIKHKPEENPFKIDKPKQKNRLQLWRDAVRSAFPYFEPEYRVKLREIASGLKNPDSSTESTLVEQLNLDSDGSEYAWRNPLLHSDTEVTQGEARFTGEYLIYTKPPVVMNEEGLDAREKDVQLVMSGKPKEEIFESSD